MEKTFNIENRRYIGSKAKLTNWIFPLIEEHCTGDSFMDIFAGTGIVSSKAMSAFRRVKLNDFLYSNEVIYEAFFGKTRYSDSKIKKLICDYNELRAKDLDANYFSENFGGKYFSKDTAKIIGYIRQNIEDLKPNISKREFAILLASLLYTVDNLANTVGHYDAYIKSDIRSKDFLMGKILPFNTKNVDYYRRDANELAKEVLADVVYIDPPYNSRQYSRFYHLLETLTKWEKGNLYGVALKPETENVSDYCKVKAPEVFADLISSLKCKHIVVSYNNTYNPKSSSSKNKISLDEINRILNNKGETQTFTQKHKFFNTGKTDFSDHQEYLFITKVHV